MDGLKLALAAAFSLALADVVALDVVAGAWVRQGASSASADVAPSAASSVAPARSASPSAPPAPRPPVASVAPSVAPSIAPSVAPSIAPSTQLAGADGASLGVIYFGSGTAKLDDGAEALLEKVLAAMKAAPARRLSIVGHADASGDVKHNRWLGDFRAKVIARWLELRGIPRERCVIAEVVLSAPPDAGAPEAELDSQDPKLARERRVDLLWEAGRAP